MTVTIKFNGALAPVSFVVNKKSLFGVSFLVEEEKDVKQLDRAMSRRACFSLTPEVGIVKFIGRVLKLHISDQGVIYAFMVDEVRVIKGARKVD